MFVLANTNGRIHDAREASISPLDRGFLYGDAVYEVWRTYEGVLFGMDEHWARLENSANALGFGPLPFDKGGFVAQARKTAAEHRRITGWKGDLYVRLQITRGAGTIGLDPALADTQRWVILIKELPELTAAGLDSGLTVACAPTVRRNAKNALNPAYKTGNYLNNILGLREALALGAHDVLMLNGDEEATETSVRNIWFVKGETAITPPLSAGILGGITRQILLRDFADNGILKLREQTVKAAQLADFDSAFITSTTQDIVPVASLDGRPLPTDVSTPARRLKAAIRQPLLALCARYPQYRLF